MVDGPNLQGPRRQNSPEPYADLVARLVKLRQDVNDLTGSILRSAGIRLSETLMTITRNLRVEGTFTSTGAANIGGTMNVTGDAVFSGDLAVPNGSITNAALQSPVSFDTISGGNTSLSISTVEQTVVTLTLTVPAGYSRAFVSGQGYMGIVNPSGTAGSAAIRVYVSNGSVTNFSSRYYQSAGPGLDLSVSAGRQVDYDGLVGGQTLTISMATIGVSNWGAVSGGAYLNAFALFTR